MNVCHHRRVSAAVFGAALLAAAAACGGSGPKAAASHGVVRAVDASARTITLEHEDIPGIMTAMTMTFEVAPDVSLEGVAPGAKVDFEVTEDPNGIRVTKLSRSP
jgi:Cu/Ag efflux protein CusF